MIMSIELQEIEHKKFDSKLAREVLIMLRSTTALLCGFSPLVKAVQEGKVSIVLDDALKNSIAQ